MPLRVLITTDSREGGGYLVSPRIRPRHAEYWVKRRYVEAVRRCGGLPLLLPPGCEDIEAVLEGISAVVITGGATDISPEKYGQSATGRLDTIDAPRTDAELALARLCAERDIPTLGVCGGMQVMAVATGGTLYQDIGADLPEAGQHEQPTDPSHPWHDVGFEAGRCRRIFGERIGVNSTHHQAVRDPGALRVTGRAPDGVAEALELPAHRFYVGLQWHPELLHLSPYEALLDAARGAG